MTHRNWLITGSSRGFEYELAKAALEDGNHVVATARRPELLAELLEVYRDQVRAVALDVTDANAARNAVAATLEAFGSLDVVANNAGYANSAAIEDMDPADFRAQIEANLFGVVNVTRAALPVLRDQRAGHFLQFSSIGGRVGVSAYQTAKFAVEGFSEVLNTEVKPLGIKVTIVEPGAFRTDWGGSSMTIHDVSPDYEQTVGAMNDLHRANDGKEAGDPAHAARILIGIVNHREPPLHLLLGAGAVAAADNASAPEPPKPQNGPRSAAQLTSRRSKRPANDGYRPSLSGRPSMGADPPKRLRCRSCLRCRDRLDPHKATSLKGHGMSTPSMPRIRFNHVSISVADLDAQVAWYKEALGFADVVEHYELADPPVRTAVLQAASGIRIEMIERVGSERTSEYNDPLEMTQAQGYGHWAVDVDDLDAAFAWLLDSGAREVWPPADAVAPGARFAYVKDPEGNLIELIQPAP